VILLADQVCHSHEETQRTVTAGNHGGAEEESSWPTSTWYCYFVWKHRSVLSQILMHPCPRMYVSFNAIAYCKSSTAKFVYATAKRGVC
jgi:hypothetical protein